MAERGAHVVLDTPLPQPHWVLPLIANGTGSISSTTNLGKVTYIDFWASWCGPCRLSLPALNQLSKGFDNADFRVIAISVDYVDEDALDFLDRYSVDYPVAIDTSGDLGRAFAVAGMPSGYLIDRAGPDSRDSCWFPEGRRSAPQTKHCSADFGVLGSAIAAPSAELAAIRCRISNVSSV
jgi:thiol-disulfide isomerase/thioredoxin